MTINSVSFVESFVVISALSYDRANVCAAYENSIANLLEWKKTSSQATFRIITTSSLRMSVHAWCQCLCCLPVSIGGAARLKRRKSAFQKVFKSKTHNNMHKINDFQDRKSVLCAFYVSNVPLQRWKKMAMREHIHTHTVAETALNVFVRQWTL